MESIANLIKNSYMYLKELKTIGKLKFGIVNLCYEKEEDEEDEEAGNGILECVLEKHIISYYIQ